MNRWIDYTQDERQTMIQHVADVKQIDEPAAEKDWWVTAVLYALFHTNVADNLLFKGGTSLSKGWDFINRFSEDIDLALSREFFLNVKKLPCARCGSNTQIHHLREAAQDYLFGEFKKELSGILTEMGLKVEVLAEDEVPGENGERQRVDHDKDPSVIYVKYKSLYSSAAVYAKPVVKVEISVLSMDEPYEMKRISSLVEQVYEREGIAVDKELVQTIKTVSPTRTFLEKAFLMCEEYQKTPPRTYRMSRHFYDLERLMDTEYGRAALMDNVLYQDIINHRRKFYHVGAVDYDQLQRESISIVPPKELMPLYEADYADMRKSFIYDSPKDFEQLMARMVELEGRFRNEFKELRK